MTVLTEDATTVVDGSPMRVVVTRPNAPGRFPGVLLYSDIFQLTGPMLRACARLASSGFVVAAPEIYHRSEPPGSAIPFDDPGRTRGLADAKATSVAAFDADARATLDLLRKHDAVNAQHLAAGGFCLGGHLAFRAAFQSDVAASVCFYGTGLHNGELGADRDAGSLARASDIRGELLLIFGLRDPHVPPEGRSAIEAGLRRAGTRFAISLYDGEHAFMRDEGPRYDPELTERAWSEAIGWYRRAFALQADAAS